MSALAGRLPSVISGLSACLFLAAFAAAQSPTGSGKFQGSKHSFEVHSAYAFWSRSGDKGALLEVAISNGNFNEPAFDVFYDPRPVIASRFVDEDTAVVYFEFEPNGKYHGVSYYLGPGDGCGFCYDSKVKSTVRLVGQRLQGSLVFQDDSPRFDVQIDVPMPSREWGKALAGDGGEIGAAYRAYNAAMEKDDRKAIFDLLDEQHQQKWKDFEKEGKLDVYLSYRKEDVHWNLRDARIVGGYIRDSQAVLLVEGKNTQIDRVHGQATLNKEKGRWKVHDEVFESGD